ncbi:hypothetical protein E4T56_gene11668 [Termitomyces sp. T112]|nr:hypothetical protein E4T56_gene11668 [Termitomyces sp. T112]
MWAFLGSMIDPDGNKIKASLSTGKLLLFNLFPSSSRFDDSASHKLGSDASLTLLDQVDAVLEAVLLDDDSSLVQHADFEKHQEAVELVAQQQLLSPDILLQTLRVISECLFHPNKALGPSEVDCAGTLLGKLNITAETNTSNVGLTDSSEASAENLMDLSAAVTV